MLGSPASSQVTELARADLPSGDNPLTIYPLNPKRRETGVLTTEQFRAILVDATDEFQAVRYLKRRRHKSRGSSSAPPFDATPAGTDALLEELRCAR